MDLYILDSTYTQVAVIDSYKSLIWTKRYFTYGDFELYIPANKKLLPYLKPDNLVIREDDDSVMIIEKIVIQTDVENGDFFTVSGRSFESILLRRVFQYPATINVLDPIQGIKALVTAATTDSNPRRHWREIPELVVDDSFSIEKTLKAQFTGDTLLDAISSIGMRFGFGFKMTISNSQFILSFYQGERVDVTFSPEFDNLINSTFTYDKTNFATFIWVAGEGEGKNRKGYGELRNIDWSSVEPVNPVLIPMAIEEYNPNIQQLNIYRNGVLQTIGTDCTTDIVIDEDNIRNLSIEFPDGVLASTDAIKAEVYTIGDVTITENWEDTQNVLYDGHGYVEYTKPSWYGLVNSEDIEVHMYQNQGSGEVEILDGSWSLVDYDSTHLRLISTGSYYTYPIRLTLSAVITYHDQKIIHTVKTVYAAVDPNAPLSIALREVYVDARDLSSNNGEIGNQEYIDLLLERADEKFSEHSVTKVFEAEIEPRMTFKYKEDYNLGDIVEVTTEYGVTAHPRIVEIIESWDENGYTVIPTLEELEVD